MLRGAKLPTVIDIDLTASLPIQVRYINLALAKNLRHEASLLDNCHLVGYVPKGKEASPVTSSATIKALMRAYPRIAEYHENDNLKFTRDDANFIQPNFFVRHWKKLVGFALGAPIVVGGGLAALLLLTAIAPPLGLSIWAAIGIVAAAAFVITAAIEGATYLVQNKKEQEALSTEKNASILEDGNVATAKELAPNPKVYDEIKKELDAKTSEISSIQEQVYGLNKEADLLLKSFARIIPREKRNWLNHVCWSQADIRAVLGLQDAIYVEMRKEDNISSLVAKRLEEKRLAINEKEKEVRNFKRSMLQQYVSGQFNRLNRQIDKSEVLTDEEKNSAKGAAQKSLHAFCSKIEIEDIAALDFAEIEKQVKEEVKVIGVDIIKVELNRIVLVVCDFHKRVCEMLDQHKEYPNSADKKRLDIVKSNCEESKFFHIGKLTDVEERNNKINESAEKIYTQHGWLMLDILPVAGIVRGSLDEGSSEIIYGVNKAKNFIEQKGSQSYPSSAGFFEPPLKAEPVSSNSSNQPSSTNHI